MLFIMPIEWKWIAAQSHVFTLACTCVADDALFPQYGLEGGGIMSVWGRRLLRISSIGFRRSLDDESGKKIISGVSRFNLSSHCTMGNFCSVLKMKTYEFDATADESAKKMISGPLSTDFKDVTFLHEMKTCSNSYASE